MTIKQVVATLNGAFPTDEVLFEALPPGRTVISTTHCAKGAWTITGKLAVQDTEGNTERYFVKIAFGEPGRIMLGGEFESAKVIHAVTPDFIPAPIGFGRFRTPSPATYFYMSEYVDMDVPAIPDPDEFGSRLARLHRGSQSPNGKFGFHDTWAAFYRDMFLGVCALDMKRNGPWPEYERAIDQIVQKVIPRLLDNLLDQGQPIKPCIIHGDLWDGNVGLRKNTGASILFDAGSFYGHNEMELSTWRCEYTSVFWAKEYTEAYLRHYPAAEPAGEFEDRNRLYSLKGVINYSAGHTGSQLRKTAYNNMCYLCEKYAPIEGIAKYDPRVSHQTEPEGKWKYQRPRPFPKEDIPGP
ncbi:Fructosamine kinase-domain-containing protein [Staphylotrichum tortipilum]|uniref:protein-ribulosamine 3-kinase n=1 Tax=Staphylotrichum tortipilum TaxID=2831512 RepID=A0AAN6MMD6_9PEZI|nr:Fructosamine kinase-domain-containing protein [Staphylotrichum longicolle]